MRKKMLISAAIAAAVLIIVLAVILIAFPHHNSVDSGDTGSLYAYSFTQQRGGLLVTISGGEDGCSWSAQPVESGVAEVSSTPAENGQTAFLVSPLSGGDGRVVFDLKGDRRVYQIYVDIHAVGRDVRVVSSGHQAFSGELSDESGSYTIFPLERGKYLICLAPRADAQWAAESENGCVRCVPYDLWDGAIPAELGDQNLSTCFSLSCVRNEPDVVYIHDRKGGEALRIELEYDEQQGLHPVSHGMVKYGSKEASDE